ncbi:MAG: tetratricopeptide repeat protein [Chloroflexota bacterium]|nr:tetratricopeptide repeat protein [Chloroflexota bacterium]
MAQAEDQGLDALIRQAEQALLNEKWEEAHSLFEMALARLYQEEEPSLSHLTEAYNGRGVALLQLGYYQQAIKSLRQALEYQPTLTGAYFNLGLCYEALGNTNAALEAYSRAIELEPHDAEVYFRRGGVWFMREEYQKTVEDTSRAIELHPVGAITGPYLARGLAYYRLEQYTEAQADFAEAMKADPQTAAEACFYRALTYIDTNDAGSAYDDLQAYLSMTGDPASTMAEQAREILQELEKLL